MTGWADADLYLRGAQTLVGSWEAYARGPDGVEVIRSPGVAIAVFPSEPERAFLQQRAARARPLLFGAGERLGQDGGCVRVRRGRPLCRLVHESDEAMRDELEARESRRGSTGSTSQRARWAWH